MKNPLPRVSGMSRTACRLAILVLCVAGLAPVSAAQAQWVASGASRRPPPLYPYELQPGQSYAVEVAPGTYVIHHSSEPRSYRAAGRRAKRLAPSHREATPRPTRTHADRALIEELRRRDAQRAAKVAARKATKKAKLAATRAPKQADKQAGRKPDKVINTRQVVREKPIVIETRRVVNDPPKVITRRHYVDDAPGRTGSIPPKRAGNEDPRVIHADAEITILGPDRMSIRLVRKDGQSLDAEVRGPQGR